MPTKIEWTEVEWETWNPVTKGNQFWMMLHPKNLGIPLRWRRPRRVVVCSMGDLFHPNIPFDYIAAVFGVMAATQRHMFRVLTERPEQALAWFAWLEHGSGRLTDGSIIGDLLDHLAGQIPSGLPLATWPDLHAPWPLRNVQIGVTAEDQPSADERIPLLLQIPAAIRFVSCEPLRGPIDLADAAEVTFWDDPSAGISWVTAGAETGPGAPQADPNWFRSIRDQCVRAGVPFFQA